MILDGLLQFTGSTPGYTGGIGANTFTSDSPTTGTQTSTNVIDLLNARDMGIGDDPALKILCEVTAAFTGGTSIQVTCSGSTDNSNWTVMATGPAVTEVNAAVGVHLMDLDLPRIAGAYGDRPGAQSLPRYLRLNYVTVGTHTGGSVYAALVLDRQDQISYPPGIVIAN